MKQTMIGTLINVLSPRCFPMSCLMPDGSLNEQRWRYYCRKIASYAGYVSEPGKRSHVYIRVFPWLGIDRNMFPDEPLEGNMNHYPWQFRNGKFDFKLKNELFYRNVERLFAIANGEGVVIKWSCLDRCHMHNNNVPETPFLLNRNDIINMYDRKARPFIQEYLRKILKISKKVYIIYEIAEL